MVFGKPGAERGTRNNRIVSKIKIVHTIIMYKRSLTPTQKKLYKKMRVKKRRAYKGIPSI